MVMSRPLETRDKAHALLTASGFPLFAVLHVYSSTADGEGDTAFRSE